MTEIRTENGERVVYAGAMRMTWAEAERCGMTPDQIMARRIRIVARLRQEKRTKNQFFRAMA